MHTENSPTESVQFAFSVQVTSAGRYGPAPPKSGTLPDWINYPAYTGHSEEPGCSPENKIARTSKPDAKI